MLDGREFPVEGGSGPEGTSHGSVHLLGDAIDLGRHEGVLAPEEPLEVRELDLPLLEEVHEAVEPVQLSSDDLFFINLQQAHQSVLQVHFTNEAVKVLIKALEGILDRQLRLLDPLFDLLHNSLLPVE